MAIRIITADERVSAANNKTSFAIFGPPGAGKTSLLKTLPGEQTVCIDLEAGLKSVQDWRGASIPVRTYVDFRELVTLIAGPDPAVHPNAIYSQGYHDHVVGKHQGSGLVEFLSSKSIVFVDSITDLSRQVMTFARQQPEAFSERTGKPDTRGAYGLLGREVIHALKLLQHAPGRTVVFVGVLEKVTDEFNLVTWQPQMEGARISRELPGIVDQVMTMHFFDRCDDGFEFNEKGPCRRLVCQAGNPWGLPAKDRSGQLNLTEPPDLGALFAKVNVTNAAPFGPPATSPFAA